MTELLGAGLFGNYIPTWLTLEDALTGEAPHGVSIRYKRGIYEKSRAETHVPQILLRQRTQAWLDSGVAGDKIFFNPSTPDNDLLFQGEVWDGGESGQWSLRYDDTPGRSMPEAMSHAKHLLGPSAKLAFLSALDGPDRSDVEWLMEAYPDTVLEFGLYTVPLGVYKRRLVLWEARSTY